LARTHHPDAEFVCSFIDSKLAETLPAADFDLVISSDVIEHLYRPADLLEAAIAILKPGGHLIIGTPYHGYIKNLALSVSGRMDSHFTALWDGGHIKFFSVRTLTELIRHYGFTDLSFSYYGRAPYMWKNMFCHARKAI
jgi:2-polyprenyl-3-methyl-5-hydroxy-6-metoxy-1,4-benzoquinol methylase